MHRMPGWMGALLLALPLFAQQPPAPRGGTADPPATGEPGASSIDGRVTAIDHVGETVTIEADGQAQTFRATGDTLVLIDGVPSAGLGLLQEGQHIRATMRDDSARQIEVNPAQQDGTLDPGSPTQPDEPTDPRDSMPPGEPTDPRDPMQPGEPTDPRDPTPPGEPTDPRDPMPPGEPTDPRDPMPPGTTPGG